MGFEWFLMLINEGLKDTGLFNCDKTGSDLPSFPILIFLPTTHLPAHSRREVDRLKSSAVKDHNSFRLVVVLHIIADNSLRQYVYGIFSGAQLAFDHSIGITSTTLDRHPFLLADVLPVIRNLTAAVALQLQIPPEIFPFRSQPCAILQKSFQLKSNFHHTVSCRSESSNKSL